MTLLVSSVDGVWRIAHGEPNDGSGSVTADDGMADSEDGQWWQPPTGRDSNRSLSHTSVGGRHDSAGRTALTEGKR